MLDLRTGTKLWSTFGPIESGGNLRRGRLTMDIEDRADEQAPREELSWPWTLSREGCNCGTLTVDM